MPARLCAGCEVQQHRGQALGRPQSSLASRMVAQGLACGRTSFLGTSSQVEAHLASRPGRRRGRLALCDATDEVQITFVQATLSGVRGGSSVFLTVTRSQCSEWGCNSYPVTPQEVMLLQNPQSHVCLCMQVAARPCRPRVAQRPTTTAALTVRPYTVRRGDTLESIAEKRGE